MSKEWWIEPSTQQIVELGDTRRWKGIHVIECSAYQDIKAELEQCYKRKLYSHRKRETELESALAAIGHLREALESSNKTLRYTQEEYAHGHGVKLIHATIEHNTHALSVTSGFASVPPNSGLVE